MQEAIKRYYEIGKYRSKIILNRAVKFNQLLKLTIKKHDISPITPIMFYDSSSAIKLSHYLQNKNWPIQAVRHPTVPRNKARIRITVKWCNSIAQLHQLSTDIVKGLESLR